MFRITYYTFSQVCNYTADTVSLFTIPSNTDKWRFLIEKSSDSFLLLSSEIAKTEAIVTIVEPVQLNAKRASLLSSDLIDLCINLRIYCTDPQQHEIYLFYMIKKKQIIVNGDPKDHK